ncbi:MAG: NUDIX domain-containing protein, partial [bacterium]|nr:NUDIX domain-containing protein [bacterium]
GGKVLSGEDVTSACIREAREEIKVEIDRKILQKLAELHFSFDDNPDWEQKCSVFVADLWQNEPKETEEMRPRWFKTNALPFQEMWVDDPFWLPHVLDGKKIKARFTFSENGAALSEKEVIFMGLLPNRLLR